MEKQRVFIMTEIRLTIFFLPNNSILFKGLDLWFRNKKIIDRDHMVKIIATHNIKPKRTEELTVISKEDLVMQIDKIFNVEPKNIKFMKPPIKDEASFQQKVLEGTEVLFMGAVRKEKTEEEIAKEIDNKKKEEEKIKEAQKKIQELKLDAHKKIIQKLQEKNITERGFSYMDERGEIVHYDTDHYTSVVHLLRACPELYRYCHDYKVQAKNPDGLVIKELYKNFQAIENHPDRFVDPLDWCSAFIAFCADDIEYPYPTYDFNYIVSKIFLTIENAYVTDVERRDPNATPGSYGPVGNMFGMDMNLKRIKLTPLDYDDFEVGLELDKRRLYYCFECDLSKPEITVVEEGIFERFKEKIVWDSFYTFDLEYKETAMSIERPCQYALVHMNRIGYPPNKDEGQEIKLLLNKKSTQKVRTKAIIDLGSVCSITLNDRLETGKFERHQLFSKFVDNDEYGEYLKELESKGMDLSLYSTVQLNYMFFDNRTLFKYDIFHEYYFSKLKGAKQTGEYRIMGLVLHKGDYYHHRDPSHNVKEHGHTFNQCRGEFMVFSYKRGDEWLKFHDAEVEIVDLNEVLHEKYWGGGEWTPVLGLYRQIMIKNIEIEIQDE